MTEQFEATAKCATDLVVSMIPEQEIVALYIGGTTEPEDRIPESDIDLIGVVDDGFSEELESQANERLADAGLKTACKLRVLFLSELGGGIQRGFITRLIPIRLLVRRMPHWRLVWGRSIDESEMVDPYEDSEELMVQAGIARSYIGRHRDDVASVPFEWIPKMVLYLAATELAAESDLPFSTSFTETVRGFAYDTKHIVHKAMAIRQAQYKMDAGEKSEFIERVVSYVDGLERRHSKSSPAPDRD